MESVERLGGDYVFLSVRIDSRPLFNPGQFMMIQTADGQDPLLLRPFSIFRERHGIYDFLIKIVGRGTRAIAGFGIGKKILLTGPYGNGFPRAATAHPVIAAGGAGIASVFAFVQKLHEKGAPYELLYGARTARELVLTGLLEKYHPLIATDDGSRGYRGMLTDLLKTRLRRSSAVFACGPMPMLAAVRDIAVRRGIPCSVSLEARMACGFGVCLGCTIFDRKGNARRVCKEGPVFDAREVSFERPADKGR